MKRPGVTRRSIVLAAFLAVLVVGLAVEPSSVLAGIGFNGNSDQITATGGVISLGDDNLTTTGNMTANGLTVTGLDCTGNGNGGALTTNASGVVQCSDDDGGGGGTNVETLFGSTLINTASQLRYGFLSQDNRTVELEASFPISRGGTLKNLRARAAGGLDNSASVAVTVRVAQTDTDLTLTIDEIDGTSTVENLVDTATVNAGDLVTIRFEETANMSPTLTYILATLELES
jgi:hypothetical protein